MGSYTTAQICLDGHLVTDDIQSAPERAQKHCKRCGSSTISQCPGCSTDIRGRYYQDQDYFDLGISSGLPSYCHECGQP